MLGSLFPLSHLLSSFFFSLSRCLIVYCLAVDVVVVIVVVVVVFVFVIFLIILLFLVISLSFYCIQRLFVSFSRIICSFDAFMHVASSRNWSMHSTRRAFGCNCSCKETAHNHSISITIEMGSNNLVSYVFFFFCLHEPSKVVLGNNMLVVRTKTLVLWVELRFVSYLFIISLFLKIYYSVLRPSSRLAEQSTSHDR